MKEQNYGGKMDISTPVFVVTEMRTYKIAKR
jgi:hypothetical protein